MIKAKQEELCRRSSCFGDIIIVSKVGQIWRFLFGLFGFKVGKVVRSLSFNRRCHLLTVLETWLIHGQSLYPFMEGGVLLRLEFYRLNS